MRLCCALDFLNSLCVTMPSSESSGHPISTTRTVNKSIHDLVNPNQRSNCNTLLHLFQHLVIITEVMRSCNHVDNSVQKDGPWASSIQLKAQSKQELM